MGWTIALALTAALLGGCASGTLPASSRARLSHPGEQTPEQQRRDIQECTTWAQQESAKASGFGGVLDWLGGAATGAGTAGYGGGQEGADRAYTVCMNGRGYSVYW